MIRRLTILFRKTFIAKFLFGRKRSKVFQKSTVKSPSPGAKGTGSSKKSDNSKQSLQDTLKDVVNIKKQSPARTFIIIVVLVAVIFGSVTFLNMYYSISIQPYVEDEVSGRSYIFDTKEFNVAFFVTEPNNEYEFISMLMIIQADLQNDRAVVYALPTYNLTRLDNSINRYPIRNVFNNVGDKKQYTEALKDEIEDLTAIRIDRYIAMDRTALSEFVTTYDVSMEAPSALGSDAVSIDSGAELKGDELVEYVLYEASDEFVGRRYERQLAFFEQLLDGNFGRFDLYQYFFDYESLTSLFNSNMTRSEFVGYIGDIRNWETEFISLVTLDVKIPPDVIGLQPDVLVIDDTIQKFSRDLDVVAEQVELEIYNASDIAGYATSMRRQLTNRGASVVKYGNYFEPVEENTLYIITPELADRYTSTINAVRRTLRDNVTIRQGGYLYNSTGDLILILAEE